MTFACLDHLVPLPVLLGHDLAVHDGVMWVTTSLSVAASRAARATCHRLSAEKVVGLLGRISASLVRAGFRRLRHHARMTSAAPATRIFLRLYGARAVAEALTKWRCVPPDLVPPTHAPLVSAFVLPAALSACDACEALVKGLS